MLRTLRSVMRFRRIEWNGDKRRLQGAANVADLREIARKRLPRGVFDYIDGAAEDELTNGRNVRSFDRLEFVPHILRGIDKIDVGTKILGADVPFPVVLAPTGFTRIADRRGELAVARAAARVGVPYSLSTLSTQSIEDVAAAGKSGVAGSGSANQWFQVYVWRDRGLVGELLERAKAAGYRAIIITVDTAVLGRRERDVRSGFSLPPKLGLSTVIDGLLHPGWTFDFVRSEPIAFANVRGRSVGDGSDPVSLAHYVGTQFDASISWRDVDWIRSKWDGPVVIKGIQALEDARIAASEGVDAIALSNHGGRQLDGAPPPVELIEPVAQAVGGELEILCDGGVRRGSDVAKAMALGATACMVGRPYLYALGAAGERGVGWVLDFLRQGLERTLALTGRRNLAELDRGLVRWRGPGPFDTSS